MKSTLPNIQTKKLSQDGLVFHEIIADGLIHTASVFGIEPNERFVERVAAVAWFNGAVLAETRASEASQIAQLLVESTEAGSSSWVRLCRNVTASIDPMQDAIKDIQQFYNEKYGVRSLHIMDPKSACLIRQIIGEAALGGILSKHHFPNLYQVLIGQTENFRAEPAFLSTRFTAWATDGWKPQNHPLIELAGSFYKKRPYRWALILNSLGYQIQKIVGLKNPWLLDKWLRTAWIEGIISVNRNTHDVIKAVAEQRDSERLDSLRIFRECVVKVTTTDGKVDLLSAFRKFLGDWNPYCLEDAEGQNSNPRIMAVYAYDFAMWMGVIAELPEANGGLKGAL